MRLGPSGNLAVVAGAAAALLAAADTNRVADLADPWPGVRNDPLHPSHRMNDRRLPYCAICGLSWPYRLLWEPCVGAPHPDSDLRFRQAATKRERKATKRKERE